MSELQLPEGVEILEVVSPEMAEILTPEALSFVAGLQREFNDRRKELLAARAARQGAFEAGERPDFLPETKHIPRPNRCWHRTRPAHNTVIAYRMGSGHRPQVHGVKLCR